MYLQALSSISTKDLVDICVTFIKMISVNLMLTSNVISVCGDVDVAIMSKCGYEQRRIEI